MGSYDISGVIHIKVRHIPTGREDDVSYHAETMERAWLFLQACKVDITEYQVSAVTLHPRTGAVLYTRTDCTMPEPRIKGGK